MSTSASFAPIAFPELGSAPAAPRYRSAAPVSRADFEPDDTRTRPVAVRMTPLAFPELVKDETPEVHERARVQGHSAGYAAGRRAATETLAADREAQRAEAERVVSAEIEGLRAALDGVRAAAGELNAQTEATLEATEQSVLSAAIEIAGMILGRAILEDREGAAVAALRRAMQAAGPAPVRVVRMHPADLELVQLVAEDEPGLQLLADARLQRGDAMVDLPDGVIDACLASAVERVRRALTGGDE